MSLPLPPKLSVLGIGVSRLDYDTAIGTILSAARQRQSLAVTALAVHGLMTAFQDPEFAAELNRFDVVTPDGQPVRWAMNLLGAPEMRQRVSGPELTPLLCRAAAETGVPVFFFGSEQSTLDAMRRNLLSAYPRLEIAGLQADRFREATPEEDERDVDVINRSGAGIVFVGRGCPRQERWTIRHRGRIHAAMIAVGAAFGFIAGTEARAPRLLGNLGCEWMFRLAQDPARMWRRYLTLNPLFVTHVALQILRVRTYPREEIT